jgi:hypothetical protein
MNKEFENKKGVYETRPFGARSRILTETNDHGHLDSGPIDAQVGDSPL